MSNLNTTGSGDEGISITVMESSCTRGGKPVVYLSVGRTDYGVRASWMTRTETLALIGMLAEALNTAANLSKSLEEK